MSFEFSIQGRAPDGSPIMGRDDQMHAEFFVHPRLSLSKTREANGVQVFDGVEMIRLIQPGEKDVVCVMSTDWHRARFPRQYEAFQKGQEQRNVGTPLNLLFPTAPETIATLNASHIFSIEQLANINDTAIGNLPFGRDLTNKAKQYLGSQKGGQGFHAMQSQIEALEAKLAALSKPAEDDDPDLLEDREPIRRKKAAAP